MIIGSAVSFVLEFGCNDWFPRGFRTIGGLSYLTVYQGPPCSSSTVLGVSIQVSEDRDFTDHSEDRFENMPLVLETIPLIQAMAEWPVAGWHAHVFVGMFVSPWLTTTCPRRRLSLPNCLYSNVLRVEELHD